MIKKISSPRTFAPQFYHSKCFKITLFVLALFATAAFFIAHYLDWGFIPKVALGSAGGAFSVLAIVSFPLAPDEIKVVKKKTSVALKVHPPKEKLQESFTPPPKVKEEALKPFIPPTKTEEVVAHRPKKKVGTLILSFGKTPWHSVYNYNDDFFDVSSLEYRVLYKGREAAVKAVLPPDIAKIVLQFAAMERLSYSYCPEVTGWDVVKAEVGTTMTQFRESFTRETSEQEAFRKRVEEHFKQFGSFENGYDDFVLINNTVSPNIADFARVVHGDFNGDIVTACFIADLGNETGVLVLKRSYTEDYNKRPTIVRFNFNDLTPLEVALPEDCVNFDNVYINPQKDRLFIVSGKTLLSYDCETLTLRGRLKLPVPEFGSQRGHLICGESTITLLADNVSRDFVLLSDLPVRSRLTHFSVEREEAGDRFVKVSSFYSKQNFLYTEIAPRTANNPRRDEVAVINDIDGNRATLISFRPLRIEGASQVPSYYMLFSLVRKHSQDLRIKADKTLHRHLLKKLLVFTRHYPNDPLSGEDHIFYNNLNELFDKNSVIVKRKRDSLLKHAITI